MENLISVIVPVYRVEKYLVRCIESIREQTYPNLEIILVDDGSPDCCPYICDKYAEKDRRIVVIHKENGGLAEARNAGLEVARGEYIGFIDSDDYIHPDMYNCLLKELIKNQADISVCGVKKVYTDNNYVSEDERKEHIRVYSGTQAVENIFDAELYLCSVVAWNKLYKRVLFDDIKYPAGKLHEDEFITYQLFYKSDKVVYIENKYYYYFQRKDSIMGRKKRKISDDALEAYEEQGRYFEKKEEKFILQLVKYRYLCLMKRRAEDLKKSEDKEEQKKGKELDKKFCCEYRKHIRDIRKLKRRFRLRIYYWLRINI